MDIGYITEYISPVALVVCLAAGLISGLASTGLYEAFEGIIGGDNA